MIFQRKRKYPSFKSGLQRKKPSNPILTGVVLMIGVYLSWSAYRVDKPLDDAPSGMRASLKPGLILNSKQIAAERSGVFPLSEWIPNDIAQRREKASIRNISPHWYRRGVPSKLRAEVALEKPEDFLEIYLATNSGSSYVIRASLSSCNLLFDSKDNSRHSLNQNLNPQADSEEKLPMVATIEVDTTEGGAFKCNGENLSGEDFKISQVKQIGAATNLDLQKIKDFSIKDSNGKDVSLLGVG